MVCVSSVQKLVPCASLECIPRLHLYTRANDSRHSAESSDREDKDHDDGWRADDGDDCDGSDRDTERSNDKRSTDICRFFANGQMVKFDHPDSVLVKMQRGEQESTQESTATN